MDYLWLFASFFVVALLYSAAGFGGGSSYLALLALSGLPTGAIRPIALVCNLAVTGGGSYVFSRVGITPWRRALPLVLASMPAAFVGGRVVLPREAYLLLLGGLLVVAGGLMLLRIRPTAEVVKASQRGGWAAGGLAIAIGAAVGFVSGVVGIGGGIFLSPILFLGRWAGARQIAATTSLFIALNSVAGLAGQLSVGIHMELSLAGLLLFAVIAGGQLGTRLTLHRFTPATVQKLAALLILLVGTRLVWANWPY